MRGLGDEYGGGDALAILDHRLSGEKAGRVGVWAHALLHDVEMRQSAGFELEEVADVGGVTLGGALGDELGCDAVHVVARDVGGAMRNSSASL